MKAEKTRTRYLVVMGIAGTGKTEVGKRLANALGAAFVEGDNYHCSTNIELMRSGTGPGRSCDSATGGGSGWVKKRRSR